MIKSLSRTSWLVEIPDTLHPNSDSTFPRLIQVMVEWRDEEFHLSPWRVIQTLPKDDGTDHTIVAGLPDVDMVWSWLIPLVRFEMFAWLCATDRRMYVPKGGGA
jgi:hypothetical protein